MKHILLTYAILWTITASAQHTMKDFINNSCDIVWLGLDFSKSKMVGCTWKPDPLLVKNEYIPAWNAITNESGRFDWKKAFQNDKVIIDYGPVTKGNALIDETKLMVALPYTITKAIVGETVKAIDMGDRTNGIGVVIVIEALDQPRAIGYGYIAFFDIGTRQLLHSQSVSGGAMGFNFQSFWSKSILGMRDVIASRVFRDVRKKYQ
jgi:hypothetical protein